MADPDLDQLVDEIASRVRARIGSAHLALVPLHQQPCDDDPAHCGGCGHCVTRRPHAAHAVAQEGAARLGAGPDTAGVDASLAGMIDHTLLKADATSDEVRKLCDEARRYHFASVCVNSGNVARAKAQLKGSGVMVCAVVGFPLGAMATAAKAFEAREAVRAGADEIDMVLNVGALKSRDYGTVTEDIRKVVEAARPARVKVILETGMLTDEEKVIGISLSKVAGAHFVKTSTGFGPGGATVEDIALMRRLVGAELGVKASGGVRTKDDAEKMRSAGANRIGASASVAIVTGQAKAPQNESGKGGEKAGPPGMRLASARKEPLKKAGAY
jgi:deoxyribose-phosphate aldolase